MAKPTRKETRRHVKVVTRRITTDTQDIRHSDQTALGISSDAAMETIRKGLEGGK